MKKKYFIILTLLLGTFLFNGSLSAQHSRTNNHSGTVILPSGSRSPQVKPRTASILFSDSFDGSNDTASLTARGYLVYYNSDGPPGQTATWYQGDPFEFVAFNGPDSGYVAADYQTVQGINNIDNWLVLPPLDVATGDTLSFYTQSPQGSIFADSIKVMYSPVGDSLPGDTTWVLLDNFQVNTGGFWLQRFFAAPAAGNTGRFAIRYNVIEGGPFGNNSDFIGIDQIDVYRYENVGVNENNTDRYLPEMFPVPVIDNVGIALFAKKNSIMKLTLVDFLGREVFAAPLEVKAGDNKFSFDLSNLGRGVYFSIITGDEVPIVSKLIKE